MKINTRYKHRKLHTPKADTAIHRFHGEGSYPDEEAVSIPPHQFDDSTLSYDGGKHMSFKACAHTRSRDVVTDLSTRIFASNGLSGPSYEAIGLPQGMLIDAYGSSARDLEVLARRGYDTLASRINFDAMWDKLRFESNDPTFNLPVFVIELAELRYLLKSIRSHVKRLKKLLREGRKRGFRNLADVMSAGWLDYSFGTGAFVRDLVKLFKLASKFSADYDSFISGMGKGKSTRTIEYLDLFPTIESSTVLRVEGFDWTFVSNIQQPEPTSCYVCLTAAYRYWSSIMTGVLGKTKFFAQRFNILFDVSIVWELIPLSFVLDWVVPIGDYLEKLRIDAVDLNITVDGAGFGRRASLRQTVTVKGEHTGYTPVLIIDRTTNVYSRVHADARNSPKQLKLGKLTLNKVLSGSSLLWQLVLSKRV